MEKIIISGQVYERYTYYAQVFKKKRGKRKYASNPSKKNANYRDAIKRLARIINCNFTAGDLLLTLSYNDEHLVDIEQAQKDLDNFMRRLKRKYKNLTGRDLRYITSTSDKKSESEEDARIHHHILIERMDYEVVSQLWNNGDVDYRLLRRQRDYTAVAAYIIKNSRGRYDEKKWNSSRNMKKPIELPPRPVKRKGEMKIPKCCKVVERHTYDSDITGQSEYVRYIIDEKKEGKEDEILHSIIT